MKRSFPLVLVGLAALAASTLAPSMLVSRASAEPPAPPASGSAPAPMSGERARRLLVDLGAELFVRHCASCHGLEGRGDGPAASALSRHPADLTRIAARRGGTFPDGEIAQRVDGRFDLPAHGTREMPVWGRDLADPLADDASGEEVARGRIDLLVEYLKTLQQPAASR